MSDNEFELEPPSIPFLRTIGNDTDFNWLWDNRYVHRYIDVVKQYFFSPIIPREVSRILNTRNKEQLIKTRRFIVKLYNVRNKKRNKLTSEALLNTHLIKDILKIVFMYNN